MIYIADLACWEDNKNSLKTLISVEYTGVKVKLSPNFEMGVCNRTPEFLKMNLLGMYFLYCGICEASQPKESAKPKPKDEPKKEESAKPKSEPGEEEEAPKSKPKNPLDLLPPKHWVDFASLEIGTNIMAWCKPRIGCVVCCITSSGEVNGSAKVRLGETDVICSVKNLESRVHCNLTKERLPYMLIAVSTNA
nr:elongation factor 1-gamma [Quercus suber]